MIQLIYWREEIDFDVESEVEYGLLVESQGSMWWCSSSDLVKELNGGGRVLEFAAGVVNESRTALGINIYQ